MATVLLGGLIVATVAIGSWLGRGSQSTPAVDAAYPSGPVPVPDTGMERAPLGIMLAGLLILLAVAAVVLQRRRSLRRGDRVELSAAHTDVTAHGRHFRADTSAGAANQADRVDIADLADNVPPRSAAKRSPAEATAAPGPTVDLVFPFASSLAASLRDELFTHRSVPT